MTEKQKELEQKAGYDQNINLRRGFLSNSHPLKDFTLYHKNEVSYEK